MKQTKHSKDGKGYNTMRKLVIYGAGDYGLWMLYFLRCLGVSPYCFCRTEAEKGEMLEEVPVLSMWEILALRDRLLVLIAIANMETSRMLKLHLSSMLLDGSDVVECGAFLEKCISAHHCPQGGHCVICGSPVEQFSSGGAVSIEDTKLFQEHHIIGGGWREQYQCPVCGGIDRERWQLWVMLKQTGIFREKCRVLHFAPEPHISGFIAANPNCDYYTGDIVQERAMHYTDILDIQYKDETFDYVIMNHVLEHIEDMDRAMAEVKKVMKPDGKLILSFPICTDMDTLELPGVVTPEERLERYGQEDHVRLFGRDYLQRICSFDLDVEVFIPREHLTEDEIRRYGFIEDDVLMVCGKQ